LRWLDPALVTLHGDCAHLQKVWAPEPHTCFEMAMEDVTVRASPSDAAAAVAVVHPGEFAALVARSGSGWLRTELGRGNTGSSVAGWISETDVNANGDCEKLPIR